jgi:hypothetical protein
MDVIENIVSIQTKISAGEFYPLLWDPPTNNWMYFALRMRRIRALFVWVVVVGTKHGEVGDILEDDDGRSLYLRLWNNSLMEVVREADIVPISHMFAIKKLLVASHL